MSWHLLSYRILNKLPVLNTCGIFTLKHLRYRGWKKRMDGVTVLLVFVYLAHTECTFWHRGDGNHSLFYLLTNCFGFSKDELTVMSYDQMTGYRWLEVWWIRFLTPTDPSKHVPLFITLVKSEQCFMTYSLQDCLHLNQRVDDKGCRELCWRSDVKCQVNKPGMT